MTEPGRLVVKRNVPVGLSGFGARVGAPAAPVRTIVSCISACMRPPSATRPSMTTGTVWRPCSDEKRRERLAGEKQAGTSWMPLPSRSPRFAVLVEIAGIWFTEPVPTDFMTRLVGSRSVFT